MKKIVPFNNVLEFETDVNEITAISLEHSLEKDSDSLSGVFYIGGEYKMLNGGINSQQFNFELPFDIALGTCYQMDSMVVDIDDFRYELIDNNKIKVNIDLYIDGEEVTEEVLNLQTKVPLISDLNLIDDDTVNREEEPQELEEICENESHQEEIMDDMETFKKGEEITVMPEDKNNVQETYESDIKREDEIVKDFVYTEDDLLDMSKDTINENNNENTNIMNNLSDDENYVTYKVYRIVDGDTLDNILAKYKVTKEELLSYNDNITNLKTGDKLIIPFK